MTDEYIPRTQFACHVDGEGGGHVEVTLDSDHGPEVLGGMLAAVALESMAALELRGLTQTEIIQRIILGFQSIMAQRGPKYDVEIARPFH